MKRSTRGLPAALLGVALALAVGLVPGMAKTARADATPTYTITATDPDKTVPLSESATLPYDVTLQSIAQEYPLWVGGTQVTEENMGDVLKGTANEGKVSFSPAKDGTPATLTLDGASITTGHVFNDGDNVSHSYGIYYTGTDSLTIAVASDSTVDVSGEEADVVAGIFCEYSGLAITGEGKLTVTSVAEGISGLGDVTIDKGVVDATGVNSGIIAREGDVVITNDSTVEADGGINGKRVTINSGTVKASGEWSGIFGDSVTIRGGEVTATASNGNGISANSTNDGPGTVTISGGIVSATGGANGSGIYTQKYGVREPPGNVTIDGSIASVTASGGKQAIEGIVTNAVAGMGWTDAAGTTGKAVIAINADGRDLSAYKKVQFPTPVAKVTTAPEATNPTHNGKAQELVTAGTAEGGAMRYSLDGETWSDKVPTGTDAKSYTVWYKAVGDDQHVDSEPQEVTSSIAKADPTVTAPKATNPTYNGKAQALVTAGTAEGGAMRYSLDGETWSDKVPTGTEAKSYTVWYKVAGDANHTDSAPQSVTSTIAKKDEPAPTPAATVAKAAKPATVAYPSKGKVAVSWKAAKGAKTYQLQWRKAGAKKWTTVSVKGKKKTLTGLKAGTAYEFRVRGVNGKARGKWSATSPCWLKGVSKAKAAPGKAKGSVKVTWKADKSATGGFKVFVYAKKGGKLVATKKVSKSKASVTIKGLKSGKTYYVRVRPYRVQSGTTYPGAITGWKSAKAK